MLKYQKVYQSVEEAYKNSKQSFGKFMWQNHVPVVAKHAENLVNKYKAKADLAIAGALLHDFGDAFVHRHSDTHENISKEESVKILKIAEYSEDEITEILESIIAPHSCRDGFLPQTLEGKILATADSLAHLTTDFYLQLAWMHLPDNKTYDQFLDWVNSKLDRDYNDKIFFNEVRLEVELRYQALKEVFGKR